MDGAARGASRRTSVEVDGPSRGPRDRGAQRQTKRGAGDLNAWRKGFEAEGAAKLRSRSGGGLRHASGGGSGAEAKGRNRRSIGKKNGDVKCN